MNEGHRSFEKKLSLVSATVQSQCDNLINFTFKSVTKSPVGEHVQTVSGWSSVPPVLLRWLHPGVEGGSETVVGGDNNYQISQQVLTLI